MTDSFVTPEPRTLESVAAAKRRIAAWGNEFWTPDGTAHRTWNAARKHLTGLDLLETLREAGPNLSEPYLIGLRDAVLRGWYISRKSASERAA